MPQTSWPIVTGGDARVLAEPDVQVGAADADRVHVERDLAGVGATLRPLGELDVPLAGRELRQPDHSSASTSAAVGMSSAQPSREATTAPAALAKRTIRSTSQPDEQPVAERAAERVAGAEAVDDVDRHRRHDPVLARRWRRARRAGRA